MQVNATGSVGFGVIILSPALAGFSHFLFRYRREDKGATWFRLARLWNPRALEPARCAGTGEQAGPHAFKFYVHARRVFSRGVSVFFFACRFFAFIFREVLCFLGEEDRSPEMGERELSALPFEFELTCAGAGSVRGIPIGCTALLLERQAGRQGLDQVWFLNFSYKFSHIVY